MTTLSDAYSSSESLSLSSEIQSKQRHEKRVDAWTLGNWGYKNGIKLTDTLLAHHLYRMWCHGPCSGSVWRAKLPSSDKTVILKVANRSMHSQSILHINGHQLVMNENIIDEAQIMKYLTSHRQCPPSIIKYIDLFQSERHYCLVEEDGGHGVFELVQRAHLLIRSNRLDVAEYHKLVKIMFGQMVNAVAFCHSMNVVHYDVSLENFLIEDPNIRCTVDQWNNEKIHFRDTPTVKLCDFGLSSVFEANSTFQSRKFVGKPSYWSPEVSQRKAFNAKSNDIWCLAVTLFMMVFGVFPFAQSSPSHQSFVAIMSGELTSLLKEWKLLHLATPSLLECLEMMFKYEDQRATMSQLQKCAYLRGAK